MNTCPNCGKVTGIHSSILQGCMCQYSMQEPKIGCVNHDCEKCKAQRTWVDLTDEEIDNINYTSAHMLAREVLAKLKEKNT